MADGADDKTDTTNTDTDVKTAAEFQAALAKIRAEHATALKAAERRAADAESKVKTAEEARDRANDRFEGLQAAMGDMKTEHEAELAKVRTEYTVTGALSGKGIVDEDMREFLLQKYERAEAVVPTSEGGKPVEGAEAKKPEFAAWLDTYTASHPWVLPKTDAGKSTDGKGGAVKRNQDGSQIATQTKTTIQADAQRRKVESGDGGEENLADMDWATYKSLDPAAQRRVRVAKGLASEKAEA